MVLRCMCSSKHDDKITERVSFLASTSARPDWLGADLELEGKELPVACRKSRNVTLQRVPKHGTAEKLLPIILRVSSLAHW